MVTDACPAKGSAKEAQQLWSAYHAQRSDPNRNALIVHYLPLAHFNAIAMLRKMPHRVDREDIFQSAFFGLRDAIGSFDPARGVKFESYCVIRIRGAILDGLRALLATPREVRQRHQRLEQARDRMRTATGRPPTDDELATELHIPVEEFRGVERDAQCGTSLDLHSLGSSNIGTEGVAVMDGLSDEHSPNPADEMQREDMKHLILRELGEMERRLLVMYYYDDLTMREIAAALRLSESRVSQIHAEVVERLRARLGGRFDIGAGRRGVISH